MCQPAESLYAVRSRLPVPFSAMCHQPDQLPKCFAPQSRWLGCAPARALNSLATITDLTGTGSGGVVVDAVAPAAGTEHRPTVRTSIGSAYFIAGAGFEPATET